ncbi:MAG: leucine-rich repeat protein [Abditibacteriota bacterium]|nr:leucine-rich repeat protein [Abditibacteriota bacterium]
MYGGVTEPYRWHVNAGDPFPEPNTPTKTGYTFVKWQLNGVDYDFSTPSSGDIELTAVWTANVTHTVSFMDGSTVLSTQTITHNETASRPADPTRTGVYLSGWVDSREKLYDFSEPVTADISLFASWNETSCTVTFDANGGSVNPASITLGFGGTTGYILPFRTGYICTGWAIENEEMTAYHIAATGCTQCGAELGTLQTGFDENLNGQESLKFQISNSASTWRDVFSWLGELLGGFFTAGRDGKIYLRQFGREFVDNIDASHRWNGCKFGDYEAHFSAVQLSVGQTSYRYALTNDLYACYKIQDNPFIAGEDETSIARRCYNILQMLQAIRYVPFSASLTGNPVYDLADCIRFSGGVADAGKRSCITSFAFRHNAAFQISGAGLGAEDEAETAYNEGTVGPAITPPAITPEELAERDIIRIEWTTPPTKTVYCIGENPAYSGSIITAYFTDGGTANIKDMCILWPPVTYEFTAADVGSYQLKAVKDASSSGNRFECSTDVTVKDVIAEGDWWILRGDGTLYIYQSNYSTRNGPWQQYKDSVTCVIIENGRTVIDYDSFKNYANLTRVEIPNTVTSIGSFVFYGCTSLTDVTLPDGVTSLMGDMFSYCTSLTSITIPDSVTGIYGSNFSYCTSLTSITIPDSVTSIGTYEFSYCTNLASVTLSNNITSIPDYSFMYCASLTSITIPDSVTSVGYVAFSHSGLTSVIIPDSVTNIGSGAFTGCENLANAKISSGITSIGYDTFKQCTSLASITIPSNVTSIGASAFLGCTSLENVEIQSGVTRIYGQAFYGCTSLQSVTIPNGVTKIESSAFKNCINMISATIPNSVTSIGSGAFYGTGITSVTVNSATGVTQGDGRFPNNCTINYY